jgi:hypothetical protein
MAAAASVLLFGIPSMRPEPGGFGLPRWNGIAANLCYFLHISPLCAEKRFALIRDAGCHTQPAGVTTAWALLCAQNVDGAPSTFTPPARSSLKGASVAAARHLRGNGQFAVGCVIVVN